MLVKNLMSKDIMVDQVYISSEKLPKAMISFYQKDPTDIIGVEIGPVNIQIFVYPFTGDFIPDGNLEKELRELVHTEKKLLYNLKTHEILNIKDFSEFVSLRFSECREYPVFLLDDSPILYYILNPLPQEVFTLNLLIQSKRMSGAKPATLEGRTLSAILSSTDLGIDYRFTSTFGMWNSPRYAVGERWVLVDDMTPLKTYISKLKLDSTEIEISKKVKCEIYLSDIFALPKGVSSLISDVKDDIEIYIDIRPDLFKRIFLTSGGVLVQLHTNSNATINDVIDLLGTDQVTIINDEVED